MFLQKHMKLTSTIDSQTQLVNAIKSNDPTALRTLYTSSFYKVESLVLKNKGSKEHAKDIYQEAFISVWTNIKNDAFVPQNENALQGYLYQIARNKWMDVLRSGHFKKTKSVPMEKAFQDKIEDDIQGQEAIFAEKMKLAMGAFKNLGNPCKELLTKFYFEKQSLRDIADVLQIEENTARNKKYRCMEKLRELVLVQKS